MTKQELAKALGIHKETLRKHLNRIELILPAYRKYPIEEDLFKQDSEYSFYIAGFIAADGCITTHNLNERLTIYLAEKDYDFLCKIRDILSPTRPLEKKQFESWGKIWIQYAISISSNIYANDLVERFNISHNKSLTYTFPEKLINHKLINHFMRGYFDGDGSVFKVMSRPNGKSMNIRGTPQFLQTFNKILSTYCDKVSYDKLSNKADGIGLIQYNGKNICAQIAQFLYKGATLFMKRKHDIFLSFPSYKDYVPNIILP